MENSDGRLNRLHCCETPSERLTRTHTEIRAGCCTAENLPSQARAHDRNLARRLQFNRSSVMCRGSGLSSLRSTRLTMSVSTALAVHERATLSPPRSPKPLGESISLRPPFCIAFALYGSAPEEVSLPALK